MAANGQWTICSSINYQSTVASLMPLYPTLISNYRVLIYNGNIDACVPYVGDESWTSGLGYPVREDWHAWFIDYPPGFGNQVAGYATAYNTPNNFTFITVNGAGHMVPEYRPEAALAMLQNFMAGNKF